MKIEKDSHSNSTGPLSTCRSSPGPTTDPSNWQLFLGPGQPRNKTGVLSSLPNSSHSTRAWRQGQGHLIQPPASGKCIQITKETLLFRPFSLKKKKKGGPRSAHEKRAKQMSVLTRLSEACLVSQEPQSI